MHPAERIFSQHPGLETKLGRLTPQDLRFVVRAVHDVADKWEGIALCLRVKNIDKIKKDYRGAGKRMIAVLSAWLRGQTLDDEPPSWKKVVWVVADRVGGDNPAHAERILLNYERFSQYTPSAMAAEADSSPFVQRGVSKEDIESKATDLQKELDEVEHRWYQLGILLGLPVHTLDGYEENYDELRDRLRAMLQEWLQKGYTGEYEVPSWQVLVDVVEHSAGGESPRLAAKLAEKRESDFQLVKLIEKYRHRGMIKHKSLKCLFTGPPRTGKTTLKKRLLKVIKNLISLGEPSPSAGFENPIPVFIGETRERITAFMESDVDWQTQSNLLDEAQTVIGFIHQQPTSNVVPISQQLGSSPDPFTLDSPMSDPPTPGPDSPLQDPPHSNQPSTEADTHDYVKQLIQEVLEKRGLRTIKDIEKTTTLYLIDTGGQPEFHEIMPLILNGPALYMIFFNLAFNLSEPVHIQFCQQDGTNAKITYESSYTGKQMIYQLLSSLYCLRKVLSTHSKTTAVLIGTHLDQVQEKDQGEKELQEINDLLKQLFSNAEFHTRGFLTSPQNDDRIFVPVNNYTGDEEEIQQLQTFLRKIIDDHFHSVPLPSSWLLFHLLMRHLYEKSPGVCTLADCQALAKGCGLDEDDVPKVLRYIHQHLGTILFYEKVEGLNKLVICDPNVLFKSIYHLVAVSFAGEKAYRSSAAEVRKTGEIPVSELQEHTNAQPSSSLLMNHHVIELLKHFNILTELRDGVFFMPCLLQPDHSIELITNEQLLGLCVPPLLVRFDGNYIPVGVFSALVVKLTQTSWEPDREFRYRNHISFLNDGLSSVELIIYPDFLEFRIPIKNHTEEEPEEINQFCMGVRKTVVDTLESILELHEHTRKVGFQLGFYCSGSSQADGQPHFGGCLLSSNHTNPRNFLCSKSPRCQKQCRLPPECTIWFEYWKDKKQLPESARGCYQDGEMPNPVDTTSRTASGTPNTTGSTSSSAGATVSPMHSLDQQSTPLTSGQPPSMQQAPPSQLGQQQNTHQPPLSHQGQQPQMPITSQFQQPIVAGVPQMQLQPGNQYPLQQGMQPQPVGLGYNQPTMYSAPQHVPQPQPYAQTQGQPFQQPQFFASTTCSQLQQPGQQGYGMPHVSMQVPQQMQSPPSQPAQPQFLPGTYPQQQAGNYPIPQQQQNVPHAQPPFPGSVQAGHLPQQPPQSQPQQMPLPLQSSTSQTSPPDGMSGMQPQPVGLSYNQPTMYSAPQHVPQPQPYAQTQGQPFQQPQYSASTTYSQLQQPGQQGYGIPQQNVSRQIPQQMQPPPSQPAQPQFLSGTYPQQQAGNYPIPQQQQNVPHAQQPFPGSVQVGHLPQQPPQSQPQQMPLPLQSSTSQTSPADATTRNQPTAQPRESDTPKDQAAIPNTTTNLPAPTSMVSRVVSDSADKSGKLFVPDNFDDFIVTSDHWELERFRHNGLTGKGTVIAILDTGIDTTHPAFSTGDQSIMPYPQGPKILHSYSKNFASDEPEDNITDTDGHGTYCAGIAAGFQFTYSKKNDPSDSRIFTGVAPYSQLIVCRIAEDRRNINPDNIIKALKHLIQIRKHQGAIDIISMSLGFQQIRREKEREITELLHYLTWYDQHTICIAAASNEGADTDAIWFPARCADVISIGAHDRKKNRAPFSPVGQELDFLAPGVNVVGPVIQGVNVDNGTSSAAAAVAGLVSLLIQCARETKLDPQESAHAHITKRRAIFTLLKEMSTINHSRDEGYGVLKPTRVLDQLNIPDWKYSTLTIYQKIKNHCK